ncbi:MAG: EAL domain-containing protein [Lachnospiraceae bacterium]|nr:EAL domain-containing protein [Lachnospiraceae bacterium]
MAQKNRLLIDENENSSEHLAAVPASKQNHWLTGLYSKEYFYQCAREILQENPQKQYDIICSDFENFKLINEVYGRQNGDKLLCAAADLLMKMTSGKGLCAHFNSDLFVCMREHEEAYSDDLFRQITDELNQLTAVKRIVVKWGIYVTGGRNVSIEQMCDWALETVKSIKGQYGKYFAYYDDELRNRLLREQEITACMEQALEEGQFHVWLQPKYRMDGAPLHDAEALIRWFHPQWGVQQPGQFIPLFEKNGFITKLDLYVWEEACRMLRDWKNEGFEQLNISVNISRADIYKIDLCETFVRLTEKYGISRSRLHLEITESVITENPDQIVKTVRELRKKGFIIEMDDFGSGYSSLNMLNQMPMDILKLDMRFIQSEMSKPEKQGILRYIIGLAHWLNLDVVAEGVETRRQLERLKDLDCDYVQGYYMAKPMPPEKFEELLQSRADKKQELQRKEEAVLKKRARKGILFIICEDPFACEEISSIFQESFQVEIASDEEEALSGLGRFGDRIQVTLLSITLAKQNQSSIWNTMKREKRVWNVPVILLGRAGAETEEEALEMGADDYEGLPCKRESILLRVNNVLGKKESLRRQLLNDSLPGAMVGCYWEDGLPIYLINGMMLDILGYDSEEDFIFDIDGLMINCIHPDDREKVNAGMDTQLSGALQYSLEYRIKKKDGCYIWVKDIGRLIKAENGRDALISVCMDTTAEKHHQEREREMYEREMNYFSEVSYPGGIRGRINLTKGRVERYFHTEDISISYEGDTLKQLVQKLADSAVDPEYREKLLAQLNREKLLSDFQMGKQEHHFEFLRKMNNGKMFLASMDFRLYLNPYTQDIIIFFYTQDVTEQRIQEYTFQFIAKMDYDLICDVDMVRGTYRMLSRRAENGSTMADSGMFQEEIRRTTCRLMDEATCREYLKHMDFEYIQEQLKKQKIYSFILEMKDAAGEVRTKKYQIFYINETLRRVGITRTDVTDVAKE